MISARFLRDFLVLAKPLVSLAISFTTFAGFAMASREVSPNLFMATLGVLLMASGVSALNQVLERKTDALMKRTKNRPVASGSVSGSTAVFIGISLLLLGFIVLFTINFWAAILGLFNAFWYLAVYTPLKRTSVWALLVGTLTGAIPFAIGFLAANSSQPISKALFVSFFLVMWQVPHFLLLVCKYGKEYELAGLASLTKYWEVKTILKVTLLWIVASSIAIVPISLFGIIHNDLYGYFLFFFLILSIFFIAKWVLLPVSNQSITRAMILLNSYQLILMLILVADSLI
jgi:protoheme IX farnesyltransferase